MTDTKTCPNCKQDFQRPLCSKGYPIYKSRWLTQKYCSNTCANKHRHSYLRAHAKETRTLCGGRHQDGKDQSERVRNLHGGDEAQAWPKALGSHGRVKGPLLHPERDRLFDKYLYAVDQYVHFTSMSLGQPLAHRHALSLYRHIQDLNAQLQRYDERINAAQTTGTLFY